MPSAAFLAEIIEATAAVDEVMAEAWQLQPLIGGAEATAPKVPDPSRAAVIFMGTFSDPEAKPDLPNSYDRRQVRRPGEESGKPILRVSPAAISVLNLVIRQGDLVRRQADGVVWRVASIFPMAGGTLRLTINVVG